jgi:hypothetical protein
VKKGGNQKRNGKGRGVITEVAPPKKQASHHVYIPKSSNENGNFQIKKKNNKDDMG